MMTVLQCRSITALHLSLLPSASWTWRLRPNVNLWGQKWERAALPASCQDVEREEKRRIRSKWNQCFHFIWTESLWESLATLFLHELDSNVTAGDCRSLQWAFHVHLMCFELWWISMVIVKECTVSPHLSVSDNLSTCFCGKWTFLLSAYLSLVFVLS